MSGSWSSAATPSPHTGTLASPRTSTSGSGWAETTRRLVNALDDFGFGSLGLTESDFAEPGLVVQLGRAPKRIDLLTGVDGVTFDECWPGRVEIEVGGIPVPFIDVEHLVLNKRASGRLQDLADAEALSDGGDASPRDDRDR